MRSLTEQVKIISERLDDLSNSFSMDKKNTSQGTNDHLVTISKLKKVWVTKDDYLCLVAHTVFKVFNTCLWYLDSGCSRQMSRD
jgi:hypothetical protein